MRWASRRPSLRGCCSAHRWIAYAGLLIILYVALNMIWEGGWGMEEDLAAALLAGPEAARVIGFAS